MRMGTCAILEKIQNIFNLLYWLLSLPMNIALLGHFACLSVSRLQLNLYLDFYYFIVGKVGLMTGISD